MKFDKLFILFHLYENLRYELPCLCCACVTASSLLTAHLSAFGREFSRSSKKNITFHVTQLRSRLAWEKKEGHSFQQKVTFVKSRFFRNIITKDATVKYFFFEKGIFLSLITLQAKITQLIILSLHFLGNLKTFTNRYKSKMHFGIISNLSV